MKLGCFINDICIPEKDNLFVVFQITIICLHAVVSLKG